MNGHKFLATVMVLLLAGSFQACSSSSSSVTGSPSGSLSVMVTDAPGDFDNVYITVKDIWLHTSDSAGPLEAGWIKKPLAAPVTVDLLTLTNGAMQSLWSGVTLPAGDYQQIRLVLADSDDTLTPSATAAGLGYNNEVRDIGVGYPLHIPDAVHRHTAQPDISRSPTAECSGWQSTSTPTMTSWNSGKDRNMFSNRG